MRADHGVVAELRLVRQLEEHEDVCDSIGEGVVHLVNKDRLRLAVVWNVENSPLEVAQWKARALLLCHEISKLLLVVNIIDLRASSPDRVNHVLVAHFLEHILSKELCDLRLQTWEDACTRNHCPSHLLIVKLFAPMKRDNIKAVAMVIQEEDLIVSAHHLQVHELFEHIAHNVSEDKVGNETIDPT